MRASNRGLGLLRALMQVLASWLRIRVRQLSRVGQASKSANPVENPDRTRAAIGNAQGESASTENEAVTPRAGAPAHWLEHIRSPSPPEHWLELVQKAKSAASDGAVIEVIGRSLPEDAEQSGAEPISYSSPDQAEGAAFEPERRSGQKSTALGTTRMPPASRAQTEELAQVRADGRAEGKQSMAEPPPSSIENDSRAGERHTALSQTEIQERRARQVKTEEQPRAKIHQPRRSEPKKQEVEAPESRHELATVVVIRAGRAPRPAQARPPHSTQRQQQIAGEQPSLSATQAGQAQHEWSTFAEASNSVENDASCERTVRGEEAGAQFKQIVSRPKRPKTAAHVWQQSDQRSRLGHTPPKQHKQLSGPVAEESHPTSRRPQTNEIQLPGEPWQDVTQHNLTISKAEVPQPNQAPFIITQVQVDNQLIDSTCWPELPEAELEAMADDRTDVHRGWRHLERLDAEQRGLEWNG
jgi:hypothetical protein